VRIVFVGAGEFTVVAARDLILRGHEVVVIEADRARIDELADALDCSFVHGDGTRPALLREIDPRRGDVLVCATDDDRANVLASVVGRHLGFPRIVTTVREAELEVVCAELGFTEVVVPSRSVGSVLRDAALGVPGADPARALRHGAHLASFVVPDDLVGTALPALELPDGARALWLYRQERIVPTEAELCLEAGDEVVVLTHETRAAELAARFGPRPAAEPPTG
jgi:trk system potassium uptake protein TrkA